MTRSAITDFDLASRLSFFLWGAPPDQELLALASKGQLSTAGHAREAGAPHAGGPALGGARTRFAAQWLRLQDVDKIHPDPNYYPNFDDETCAAAMRTRDRARSSTASCARTAASLDLYRADYTFVNERLARHYGFPGVAGDEFRRVAYPDDTRRGLLGQGSVLVQTSLANRTSPVLRGKWVMEVLLGTPPPPPPPNVPPLDDTAEAKNGKMLTTRERMEMHRENPACQSCHRFMDPIGLALDNFDVTATVARCTRTACRSTRAATFYDGTPVSQTPRSLRRALLKRPVPLMRTFTENLMAYALGRRVEYFDQPTVRAIAQAAGDERLPYVLVHPRRDQERRVSDEAVGACAQTP